MAQLKPGDKAPTFSLKAQDGATIKLSQFKGRKLLVFFYPRANTSGCTKQSCSVRDAKNELSGLGIDAVGISPDLPEKQKSFDEKHDLGFPLLSDPEHAVAERYGAWGEKNMYGKKVQGIIRSSFLIDERGRIVQASYKVKPDQTVPKAMAALES